MTEELLLQYLLLFGLSIIFTSISITRQTFGTLLLSGIMWFICGAANYMLDLSTLTMALSYTCLGLGLIFTLVALGVLAQTAMEQRDERWGVEL